MQRLFQKLFGGRKTSPRKSKPQLQVEGLETRALMAGDVTAYLSGSTLYIEGDAANNHIAVSENSDGSILIENTEESNHLYPIGHYVFGQGMVYSNSYYTVVNNAHSATISGNVRSISINMQGGDDSVEVRDMDLPWDLTVNLGSGVDKLTVKNVTTGDDLRISTGGGGSTTFGRDEIHIDDSHIGSGSNNDLVVSGTSGAEKLTIDDTVVEDDLYVYLTKSAEDDLTYIYPGVEVRGRSSGGLARVDSDYAYVNGLTVSGDGNFFQADRMYMYNSSFSDDLYIDGTNEANYVYVSSSNQVADWFDIDVFDGNDSVRVYSDDAVHITGGDGKDSLRGGDGNDTILGGVGDDTINGDHGDDELFGQDGKDRLDGYYGDDLLNGGAQDDYMIGGYGNDTLDGESGQDSLYGGSNDDALFGGSGHDKLYGYSGNDFLSGGSGNDYLKGENGNDGLYGGSGVDSYPDSSGHDRFYDRNGEDFWEHVGLIASHDVRIPLADGVKMSGFEAGTWDDEEVLLVDKSFQMLTNRTGNNKVLHSMPTLYRGSSWSGSVGGVTSAAAVNGGSYIVYGNGTFNGSDNSAMSTIIHETAHNWDSSWEMLVNGLSTSLWTNFYNISWSPTQPSTGSWQQAYDTRTGGDYDAWFDTTTAFAADTYNPPGPVGSDNYGKHNPREDWATSWEEYFFRSTQGANGAVANNSAMQSKIDALDAFFNTF
ncbi:MAG: calcium-binding protein [Gemmataceae bacterium]